MFSRDERHAIQEPSDGLKLNNALSDVKDTLRDKHSNPVITVTDVSWILPV